MAELTCEACNVTIATTTHRSLAGIVTSSRCRACSNASWKATTATLTPTHRTAGVA